MAVNSFREDEQLQATDAKRIAVRLLRYLKKYIKQVIVVLIAMAITVGISLFNPLLIEGAIDKYVANYTMDYFEYICFFVSEVRKCSKKAIFL